jgi:hypothetical protein
MTREEFEQAKTASNELAAALKPYTDEAALTLLLCAVIGVAMHGRITPAQVIKIFLGLCSVFEEPEELLN